MNKEIYNLIPQEIKDVLYQSEGWLVGSAVEKLQKKEEIRDFDILITNAELYAKMIAMNKRYFNKFTTFGGIKLEINSYVIDIWFQNLEIFINNASNTGIMYNLNKNNILTLNNLNV